VTRLVEMGGQVYWRWVAKSWWRWVVKLEEMGGEVGGDGGLSWWR
jgi:hypothetical protein